MSGGFISDNLLLGADYPIGYDAFVALSWQGTLIPIYIPRRWMNWSNC